jgi:hypothetical protein
MYDWCGLIELPKPIRLKVFHLNSLPNGAGLFNYLKLTNIINSSNLWDETRLFNYLKLTNIINSSNLWDETQLLNHLKPIRLLLKQMNNYLDFITRNANIALATNLCFHSIHIIQNQISVTVSITFWWLRWRWIQHRLKCRYDTASGRSLFYFQHLLTYLRTPISSGSTCYFNVLRHCINIHISYTKTF